MVYSTGYDAKSVLTGKRNKPIEVSVLSNVTVHCPPQLMLGWLLLG
jgi:hypothetical protein